MATTKKPNTAKKKPTTKTKSSPAKKAPVKKTPAKKAPVKKTTVKKSTKKAAPKKKQYETFKLSREQTPFFTYKITDQTVYWLVLSVVIFLLSLWVLYLHLEVMRIIAGTI